MTRLRRPDMSSSTEAYCPVSPMMLRTLAASRTTSYPPTVACPASGRSSVPRIRTAVVFPAPFGPSTPSTVPVGTVRSTPSSATVLPYFLTRPSATMAGWFVVDIRFLQMTSCLWEPQSTDPLAPAWHSADRPYQRAVSALQRHDPVGQQRLVRLRVVPGQVTAGLAPVLEDLPGTDRPQHVLERESELEVADLLRGAARRHVQQDADHADADQRRDEAAGVDHPVRRAEARRRV